MPKYRVIGTRSFKGHKPGSVFSADLDPAQEQRALERGSISLDTSEDTLESLSRDELNAMASAAGVDAPEDLDNKAAVVKAIRDTEKE